CPYIARSIRQDLRRQAGAEAPNGDGSPGARIPTTPGRCGQEDDRNLSSNREEWMKLLNALTALTMLGVAATPTMALEGSLNVYCSVQVEWCEAVANEFQKATGVNVNMSQKGSGEVLAQILAEAENPK